MTRPAPFVGRRQREPRLPPGQYDVGSDYPVLTAEATPNVSLDTWTFTVDGLVERPTTLTAAELRALPRSRWQGDIHCVTTWSKLGTSFTGVSLDSVLELAGVAPAATHALSWSSSGYTTNLPVADVTGGRAWLVWEHEDRPLTTEHGGPVRMLVPHLYFWKSAKWVAGIRFLDHDEQGFWERNGYHHRGDPWREQRYAGDE